MVGVDGSALTGSALRVREASASAPRGCALVGDVAGTRRAGSALPQSSDASDWDRSGSPDLFTRGDESDQNDQVEPDVAGNSSVGGSVRDCPGGGGGRASEPNGIDRDGAVDQHRRRQRRDLGLDQTLWSTMITCRSEDKCLRGLAGHWVLEDSSGGISALIESKNQKMIRTRSADFSAVLCGH